MTHRTYNSGVTQRVEPLLTPRVAQSLLVFAFVLALAPSVTAQPRPAWNRRVTGLAVTTAAGGPAGSYDVTAEWRIDLEGSSTSPVELGTAVDLSIAGGPPTTTTAEECLIWELDSGGAFDCTGQPNGTECGTASISGTPVSLTCDSDTETCSTPPITVTFPRVPLTTKDIVEVLLRPAPGAMPDSSPNDDDDGQLTFGTWNRRAVSLNVTPTAGAPAGIYDATAEVVIELTAGATVPLNLGIDTEPVDDECCQEACCCPPCAKACEGTGCGGSGGSWLIVIAAGTPDDSALPLCEAPSCNVPCGDGISNETPFSLNCDSADCVCRSETITLQWSGLSFTPGAEVYLNLRVAEGALPELQTDDDVIIAIAPCPEDECIGNLDGDAAVGAADLAMLLASWGPCAGCPADLNCDGAVGAADLAQLLASWGPCP